MIRSAYLAPTETPIRSVDVKRALLTYDRVYIADPGDRDLIPPQSFMMALGMPPFMGFNTGPVRPLGKSARYDDTFDQLIDELDIARRDGCVEVVSTYDLTTSAQGTIGAVLMGDYPLNPQFMLWSYRSVAREADVLRAAIEGDQQLMALTDDQIAELSISQTSGDGGINDDPALPSLEGPLSREQLRDPLTLIARARIASTMKSIGYCASKDLVPVFGGGNFDALVGVFASRATQVIDRVGEEDAYWLNRRRALDIAHDEYIDDAVLSSMQFDEVLKLRSTVWGDQAKARDELLNAVAELARESMQENDFDAVIRKRIQSYRALAGEVQKQRAGLSFKINCELLKGSGGGATSMMAGAATSGMLSQMQTAMGAGTLLLAGCLWAVGKIQDLKPAADQLRSAEIEFKDNVCFGMHNFYRRMASAVGSNVQV